LKAIIYMSRPSKDKTNYNAELRRKALSLKARVALEAIYDRLVTGRVRFIRLAWNDLDMYSIVVGDENDGVGEESEITVFSGLGADQVEDTDYFEALSSSKDFWVNYWLEYCVNATIQLAQQKLPYIET
jgi:hypothetical protein